MTEIKKQFANLGIHIPDLLLPGPGVDMKKWPVIACDQFTSDGGYWERVGKLVGNDPSTLNLILPEAFLNSPDVDRRIQAIHASMNRYLASEIFMECPGSFVFVERSTAYNRTRHGLMLCLDLNQYEFSGDRKNLIRPTEETIAARIPSREKIRMGAPVELPHILVLIQDPENGVFGPLIRDKAGFETLYETDLMLESGHVVGRRIHERPIMERLIQAFTSLIDTASSSPFLFAVGDGNHSLAAAKSIWNKTKEEGGNSPKEDHPARYALVEMVNLFDPGVVFEPIHRVLFNTRANNFLSFVESRYNTRVIDNTAYYPLPDAPQTAGFLSSHRQGTLTFNAPTQPLTCASLQAAVDEYLEEYKDTEVDYVHGEDAAEILGKQENNLALFLPPLDKRAFFKTIEETGALPRKAFSMGEATEKRFYLEARRIV